MRYYLALSVLLTITVLLGVLGSGKTPIYEWTRTLYFVNHNDTLWSICREYCPDKMDLQEYIYLIKQENNMVSSTVYAGDTLIILKEVKRK